MFCSIRAAFLLTTLGRTSRRPTGGRLHWGADDIDLPTGADVVAALDRDAQEFADEEDQETTIADAMADAKEAVAKEEGAASGAASTRVADDEPEEAPTRKKMRSAEAEAGPAEAAPAVASTRGPARRQAMKSRIIVQKEGSSEKYSLVCAATQTEAEIDRVLEARDRAILDEARDSFGASTPEDARLRLVQAGRACVVTGSRGRLNYLVIDGQLQKRCRYYIFRDWAETPDGKTSCAPCRAFGKPRVSFPILRSPTGSCSTSRRRPS